MTFRDRMAAEMLGVIFTTTKHWHGVQQVHEEWYWDDMKSACEVAYRLADAMREARKDKTET